MKGQAFDTFKLLIAAVVAIAILGILLNILSNMPNLTANPTNTIKTALSDAFQSQGIPSMSPSKAAFQKNINFPSTTKLFLDAVGGNSITFDCSAYLKPDSCDGGPTLMIKRDFSAYVSACCAPSGPCKVIVGNETAVCPP
jgi:hypothetical protein